MQSLLLVISDWFYRALLQVYPAGFRNRFAVEMAQVFRSLCYERYRQSGVGGVMRLWLPVLLDWAWATIYQWRIRLFKGRMDDMQVKLINRHDGIKPLSAVQAGLAILPFLAFGISSLVSRMDFFRTYPASLPLWQVLFIHPYLVFNWLILVGLGVGILAGFPRWAFPFLGWALLFAWWWSDMGFYGHSMGWKIWLPLLGVFLVTLLIRRSFVPLRALFTRMWNDWTLLSLGVYIFYVFMFMTADENHHPYLLMIIFVTTLATSAGAWGYFRSVSPFLRVLALVGGLFLTIVIGVISNATWDSSAYYGLPENAQNVSVLGLILFICLILLILGSGLLAHWRHTRNSSLKDS